MTHIYRGVEYKVADERLPLVKFVGMYRGQKYTARQTQRQQQAKSGVYRGVSWVQQQATVKKKGSKTALF